MFNRFDRAHRGLPVWLGVLTLISVGVLLVWDGFPQWFPAGTHDVVAAFSLTMIAVAYLAYQIARRAGRGEMIRSVMLVLAFLFWAANQLWPDLPQAMLFNDIAIALFVLDVFCAIVGWPAAAGDNFETICRECGTPRPNYGCPDCCAPGLDCAMPGIREHEKASLKAGN